MGLLSPVPLPYRLLALAVLAVACIGFGWVTGARFEEAQKVALQARWDTERAALAKQVTDQHAQNVQLQQDALARYVPQAEIRDHFITKTITEVRYATDNLAACRLAPDAVRLLNAARGCAGEDRPASCGADQQVRDAGPAS